MTLLRLGLAELGFGGVPLALDAAGGGGLGARHAVRLSFREILRGRGVAVCISTPWWTTKKLRRRPVRLAPAAWQLRPASRRSLQSHLTTSTLPTLIRSNGFSSRKERGRYVPARR